MLSAKRIHTLLSLCDIAIARLQTKIVEELNEQVRFIRQLQVRCTHCTKAAPLHRWTFIQDRFYVRPSGCTEGDYWTDTEVACCHIRCPACLHRNYIYNRPDRQVLVGLLTRKLLDREKLFDSDIVVESEPQSSS